MRYPFQKDSGPGSFLPGEYVAGKNNFRSNLICLGLFSVVMVAVVGAYFVTNRQWIQVRAMQQEIQAEYAKEAARVEQLEKLDDQREELMQKAAITTALLEPIERRVLLREIVDRMPDAGENVTLLEFNLDGKRQRSAARVAGGSNSAAAAGAQSLTGNTAGKAAPVTASKAGSKTSTNGKKAKQPLPPVEAPRFDYTIRIVGVARSNAQITDYLSNLKQSPILESVDLKFISAMDMDKEPMRKFEITAQFKRGANTRGLNTSQAAKPGTPAGPTSADPASTSTPTGKPVSSAAGDKTSPKGE